MTRIIPRASPRCFARVAARIASIRPRPPAPRQMISGGSKRMCRVVQAVGGEDVAPREPRDHQPGDVLVAELDPRPAGRSRAPSSIMPSCARRDRAPARLIICSPRSAAAAQRSCSLDEVQRASPPRRPSGCRRRSRCADRGSPRRSPRHAGRAMNAPERHHAAAEGLAHRHDVRHDALVPRRPTSRPVRAIRDCISSRISSAPAASQISRARVR
jgi:hypothetical protein